MIKKFTNCLSEKQLFYIFLLVHLLVWSLLPLIRVILPTDALEGIFWGSLSDFGTPKHPPLFGWIAYAIYSIFKTDFSIYFVSQLFVLGGFICIYKLAKCFLDKHMAMLSVIVLEGCWVYSYITGYYGFNPDVIMLLTLPAISLCFYNCIKNNHPKDWISLGVIVGLALLNKYQTVFLLFFMFVWALIFDRKIFKNKFLYISIIIAFLVFSPHFLWLIKYDFFPIKYFNSELHSYHLFEHLTAPLIFILVQFSLIIGVLLSVFLLAKKQQIKLSNVHIDKTKKFWFLILLGFGPILAHILMGFAEGGRMRPRWGFEFWYMIGIILFYIIPFNKIKKEDFVFTLKISYTIMLIIALSLGTLLAVEKNYRSRYPVQKVFNDIQKHWNNKLNTPLKYIYGNLEWTLPLSIYGDTHPKVVLNTFKHANPWISQDDLKRNGVFIIDRTEHDATEGVKEICMYLPETYKIKTNKYQFTLYNAFKQKREYTVYFVIVPPIKEINQGKLKIESY